MQATSMHPWGGDWPIEGRSLQSEFGCMKLELDQPELRPQMKLEAEQLDLACSPEFGLAACGTATGCDTERI